MLKVTLREFANASIETVYAWRGMRKRVEVEDDFGEKAISDTYALMLTWPGLIVHRHFNEVEYSVKQLIPSTDPSGKEIVYDDNTLSIPINYTLGKVMPGIDDPYVTDKIKLMVHIWQNMLNNVITVLSEEYIISARAEDVSDLMNDPGVQQIAKDVKSGKINIIEGESIFAEYVNKTKTLDHNTMALLIRTNGVSVNQAYQTVIIRGDVFDLNNDILPNTIVDSYAEGIKNLADNVADSRASGMSLVANGKGLSDSQWFHRKTHLNTAVMRKLEYMEDCGTTTTLPFLVTSKSIARSLLGKIGVDDKGNKYLIDKEFLGTIKSGDVLNIRSVAFCNSKIPGSPCGVCYGKMKSTIPFNRIVGIPSNIGMYASTSICNPLGQQMLSTKHLIRSATTVKYVVSNADATILTTNGDDIFVKKDMLRKGTKIILRANMSRHLSDLRSLDVLDDSATDKIPSLDKTTFEYEVEDIMIGGVSKQRHSCTTSILSRQGQLSLGFLEYILEKGWVEEDRRFISVDLEDWNHKEPILTLPYTREDLDHHRQKVEGFLTFSNRNSAWKTQVVTPKVFAETLSEFWALVNQEIKGLNIIYTEIMLASCLTKDPMNNSYKLALEEGDKYFASYIACVENRGSGTLMIFEKIQNYLSTPRSFLVKDRQPSPMEAFFQSGVS